MSATLSVYWSAIVTENGVSREFGSLLVPVTTSTIDGDMTDELEFTVAASSTVTLWSYSASKPDFVLAVISTDGTVEVGWKADKPTSSTDDTALGTYINYQTVQVESHAPLFLSADQAKVDLSATAKSTSSIAASTQGKIYELQARNNGTASRVVKLRMIN